MKTKMLFAAVFMFFGAYAPEIKDAGLKWWNTEPSRQAQKLITSLESGRGWGAYQNSKGDTWVHRGGVHVCSRGVMTWVYADRSPVPFSFREKWSIGNAYSVCLRKIASSEIDRITEDAE